jgi:hypothetical protein
VAKRRHFIVLFDRRRERNPGSAWLVRRPGRAGPLSDVEDLGMNTANLQLEGLYLAVTAIMNALRDKGLMGADEIDRALAAAEQMAAADPLRPPQVSASNVDAICFPLRYLRLANRTASAGRQLSFSELATMVGETKPDRV